MITTLFRSRLLALFMLVGLVASGPAFAQTIIDYDTDDDGNPTVGGSSAYNNAFPNRDGNAATRMGCPSGNCVGYELTANINLTTYTNWDPIGDNTNNYTGDFKGNGYTIDNLTISRSTESYVGLFGAFSSTARIESVGITNANVTGSEFVGALVGGSNGEIIACWSTGSVTARRVVGGLVGWTGSTITSSYSHASATGTQASNV